jgi:hypothetical protein
MLVGLLQAFSHLPLALREPDAINFLGAVFFAADGVLALF